MQGLGNVIDTGGVWAADNGFHVHIAGTANLGVHGLGQHAIGTQDDGVRLDTQGAQGSNGVLGRLGL